MTALDWVRSKTAAISDEPIKVNGVTYSVTRHFFTGRLSRRMISEIAKAEKIKEDFRHETFQYDARNNRAEYTLTVYTAT